MSEKKVLTNIRILNIIYRIVLILTGKGYKY